MSGIMRSPTRILAGAVAVLVVTAGALALSAYFNRPASGEAGELHIAKECSQNTGLADAYCTVIASNLEEQIKVGSRVVYLQAATKTELNSDFVLVVKPGNLGTGHCQLPFLGGNGLCVFSGGTGTFSKFRARLVVQPDQNVVHGWLWDGNYHFEP
jgi:hypothetical protein